MLFCKRGRNGLHFELHASDCANYTQNNYIFPFFLIWRLYSYEKTWNRERQCYYFTLIIALSVFITVCIFLDAYNFHKSSNKNSAPVKNQGFRWTKSDVHSNVK